MLQGCNFKSRGKWLLTLVNASGSWCTSGYALLYNAIIAFRPLIAFYVHVQKCAAYYINSRRMFGLFLKLSVLLQHRHELWRIRSVLLRSPQIPHMRAYKPADRKSQFWTIRVVCAGKFICVGKHMQVSYSFKSFECSSLQFIRLYYFLIQ